MNPYGVKVAQVWKDNDTRYTNRVFQVLQVDPAYYPGGRAQCKLLGDVQKCQREVFHARLDRFNGTKRGYSLLAQDVEKFDISSLGKPKAKKKAKAKKKRGKK